MFGFLKKLGKRSEPAPAAVPAAMRTAPAVPAGLPVTPSPARPVPSYAPAAPAVNRSAVPSRAPAQDLPEGFEEFNGQLLAEPEHDSIVPAVPVPAVTPPPAVVVELSLRKLWSKLSPEVTRVASGHPDNDAFLRLPLPLLQAQLAKGAVKMPLAQFRNYSSAKLFPSNPEKDTLEVNIPVAEIVPLLKPEHFARRPNQRKIEVPDDIGPIFGPDGGSVHGLRIAEQKPRGSAPTPPAGPLKAIQPSALPVDAPISPIPSTHGLNGAAAKAAPAPVVPPYAPPTSAPIPSRIPPSVAPAIPSPNAPIPARAKRPSAPVPAISDDIPEMLIKPMGSRAATTPIAPIAPVTSMAEPAPEEAPVQPFAPAARSVPMPSLAPEVPVAQDEPIRAPKLDPSLASLRPQPAQPAPQRSVAEGSFTLALMDVAAFWAEKGRNELANLYKHTLEIPMSTLEKTLKAGKLQFQWREIRPWVRLAPGNTLPTLADDLVVELPLAMIAPRFMEQRGLARQANRADLTGDIPQIFEQKFPAPASNGVHVAPPLGATSVPMDVSAALAPSSAGGDTAFLRRAAGKPLLEFGEIFGQPEKKNWTLAEVTQKVMSLRGVAGAIIATSDGLLVSGSWPGGVKSDAVAAFVPQMYSKIVQYGKELNIGEPGNFTLTIENVPLQIFKTGNSYFTVIGRAGENLPKAQLNAVAMRLTTTK